jgi:biopolymer transport protein ExbB/TolQ
MPINLQLPPAHLTPWNMFHSADIVVKSVIVLLLLASVITWTILLAKWLELALANRGLRARQDRLVAPACPTNDPRRAVPRLHRADAGGDPSHLATSRDVQSAFRHDYLRYAISSISDLATPRSDVAKPSVNRL